MSYQYPPVNGLWHSPPIGAVPPTQQEQRPCGHPQLVYATIPLAEYPAPLARAPDIARYDDVVQYRTPGQSARPAPFVSATLPLSNTMPMARAPTTRECDENDRRRALGLPPVLWPVPAAVPAPVPAALFLPRPPLTRASTVTSNRDANQRRQAPLLPPPAQTPSVTQSALPSVYTRVAVAPELQQQRKKQKKKKEKKLSKKQQSELDRVRWAVEKAERAKLRASKPPPPPTPAELRRIEEKKRIAARPWPPYAEPPKPFPPLGVCTYEPQIGHNRKRKPLPSSYTTMCGTYATGPYAGQYGQEYWEMGFNRCRTLPDGKHEYDDFPDVPEDSFLAAALRRGEIHPQDHRGAFLDREEGRSIPFPPARRAVQDWQKYLNEDYNPDNSDYGCMGERLKPVPAYSPPSPTARPIPFKTRELLPDTEWPLGKQSETWDAEVEEVRKRCIHEYIVNHGLWGAKSTGTTRITRKSRWCS